MHDAEIRVAVEAHLRQLHGDEPISRYRHELGICLGQTRVDLAVINGKISGFEIKGSRDKLSRLKNQTPIYDRVIDESFLVVEPRDLVRAKTMLPRWWGIWEVCEMAHGAPNIRQVREAKRNPRVEPFAVAQLLWRDEGMEILRRLGAHGGMSRATRFEVWDRLVSILRLEVLQFEVRAALKGRQDWPSDR